MNRSLALRLIKTAAAAADAVRPKRRGVVLLAYHRVGGGSDTEVDILQIGFEGFVQQAHPLE